MFKSSPTKQKIVQKIKKQYPTELTNLINHKSKLNNVSNECIIL